MTGDPMTWAANNANGSYTLPTLNDVPLLTYLLAQNGCGSVWYQEYMDSSGNKVTAVRSMMVVTAQSMLTQLYTTQ